MDDSGDSLDDIHALGSPRSWLLPVLHMAATSADLEPTLIRKALLSNDGSLSLRESLAAVIDNLRLRLPQLRVGTAAEIQVFWWSWQEPGGGAVPVPSDFDSPSLVCAWDKGWPLVRPRHDVPSDSDPSATGMPPSHDDGTASHSSGGSTYQCQCQGQPALELVLLIRSSSSCRDGIAHNGASGSDLLPLAGAGGGGSGSGSGDVTVGPLAAVASRAGPGPMAVVGWEAEYRNILQRHGPACGITVTEAGQPEVAGNSEDARGAAWRLLCGFFPAYCRGRQYVRDNLELCLPKEVLDTFREKKDQTVFKFLNDIAVADLHLCLRHMCMQGVIHAGGSRWGNWALQHKKSRGSSRGGGSGSGSGSGGGSSGRARRRGSGSDNVSAGTGSAVPADNVNESKEHGEALGEGGKESESAHHHVPHGTPGATSEVPVPTDGWDFWNLDIDQLCYPSFSFMEDSLLGPLMVDQPSPAASPVNGPGAAEHKGVCTSSEGAGLVLVATPWRLRGIGAAALADAVSALPGGHWFLGFQADASSPAHFWDTVHSYMLRSSRDIASALRAAEQDLQLSGPSGAVFRPAGASDPKPATASLTGSEEVTVTPGATLTQAEYSASCDGQTFKLTRKPWEVVVEQWCRHLSCVMGFTQLEGLQAGDVLVTRKSDGVVVCDTADIVSGDVLVIDVRRMTATQNRAAQWLLSSMAHLGALGAIACIVLSLWWILPTLESGLGGDH